MENVARFMGQGSIAVAGIMHSGKLRARQTAEILAKQLAPNIALQINENISPLDLPTDVAEEIGQWQDDILLVGHLPHLAKLVSLLLTDQEIPAIVSFNPGAVACLEKSEGKAWLLNWLISPDMIKDDRQDCDANRRTAKRVK